MRRRYPSLDALNASWKTGYASWDDVKLTKEFSANAPTPDADGWAHPEDSPLGPGVKAVSLAPYADTAEFYNWYYDQVVGVAREILRERINPVTLTMSSAPTIGSADYDVRQAGLSAWNESQWHSVSDGPEPGFGLIWGHFGFIRLKNARRLKKADMLILIGVTSNNLQERDQHVHEHTLPCLWSSRLQVCENGICRR